VDDFQTAPIRLKTYKVHKLDNPQGKNAFNVEVKSRFDILLVDQDDPVDVNAVLEKIRVMYYETS
jgi:hypothetical protein